MGRLSPGGREAEEEEKDLNDVDGGGERSNASLNSCIEEKNAAPPPPPPPPLELLLLQLQRRFRSDRSIAKRRRDEDIALSLACLGVSPRETKKGK